MSNMFFRTQNRHVGVRVYFCISTVSGLWFGTLLVAYIGNDSPNWCSYLSEGLKPPARFTFCQLDKVGMDQ